MRMIGDFSPLIFLSAIGSPDILRIKFGEVLIPEAVYQEVAAANLERYDKVKKDLFLFFGFFPNIIKKLCRTFYGLFISYPNPCIEFVYQLISR